MLSQGLEDLAVAFLTRIWDATNVATQATSTGTARSWTVATNEEDGKVFLSFCGLGFVLFSLQSRVFLLWSTYIENIFL